MLLEQICKGLPIGANKIVPEIFLTMVQDNVDTINIKSELIQKYNIIDKDDSYMDNLITELPFTDELVHLSSFKNIMEKLKGREMYFNIDKLVRNNYLTVLNDGATIENREEVINKIYKLANSQITAEGHGEFSVLLTQPINVIIKKFYNSIPQIVILGAKGAGKTFLFREILRNRTWQKFTRIIGGKEQNRVSYVIPLVTSSNIISDLTDTEIIQGTIENFNKGFSCATENISFWYDNRMEIYSHNNQYHNLIEWSMFWKKMMLNAFKNVVDLVDVDKALNK